MKFVAISSDGLDITISILLSKTSSSSLYADQIGLSSFEKGDGESGIIIWFIFCFKSIYFDLYWFQTLSLVHSRKKFSTATVYSNSISNFGIFFPNESILILNSSVWRAFKIIPNDIKIVTIFWDSKGTYQCFNFCVGDYVGWHLATNILHVSKDALEDFASSDTSIVIAERRGI